MKVFEIRVKPKNDISKVVLFAHSEAEAQLRVIEKGYEIDIRGFDDALADAMKNKK
jgi:hypothetical protein